MAQALGTGGKKSVNVDLNLIPFIDLMSCLTAFLLVTAVWTNIARLDARPAGHAHDAPPCLEPDCDAPRLSVLIEADDVWIGVSRIDDFQRFPHLATGPDWPRVEDLLRKHKASALFDHSTAIEIAAAGTSAHPVAYHDLIAAMDLAVKVGFLDVGLTDPEGLSARPAL